MNIKEAQIDFVVQCDKQVAVYDTDNLIDLQNLDAKETQQKQQLSERRPSNAEKNIQLIKEDKDIPIDPKLLEKLQDQIKHTQEGFFSVTKMQQPIKKPRKLVKSLESIEKVAQLSLNSTLKEGYMEKKTDGIIFKWKRRYFTLTPEKLYFFESDKKQKVIGCINIRLIAFQVKKIDDQIILDFNGQCQNIVLKCQNQQQSQQWRQWLQQVSKFQSKQKKLLIKTMNKPFYSQSNTVLQRQFLSDAETGDILLFYTRHIGAQFQRMITGSDFDHVAMIVKFRSYEVMVFQSNQMTGVSLFQWGQYVKCFNLYDKITYRKLTSPRKAELQHGLLKFVKINIGRKYQLSISKLLTFQSNFDWNLVNQDTTRGYFCSQLVAKAYKGIGLLDQTKSSCRYWPVDFSQKSQLKLQKGAYLGPEQAIVLNKHIKKML